MSRFMSGDDMKLEKHTRSSFEDFIADEVDKISLKNEIKFMGRSKDEDLRKVFSLRSKKIRLSNEILFLKGQLKNCHEIGYLAHENSRYLNSDHSNISLYDLMYFHEDDPCVEEHIVIETNIMLDFIQEYGDSILSCVYVSRERHNLFLTHIDNVATELYQALLKQVANNRVLHLATCIYEKEENSQDTVIQTINDDGTHSFLTITEQ